MIRLPANKTIGSANKEEIKIENYEQPATQNSKLSGKKIVFTGTLETLTRGEAKVRAEAIGAKVSGSLSKNTDFILVGTEAGAKSKKALELGVTILSESEWLDLLDE